MPQDDNKVHSLHSIEGTGDELEASLDEFIRLRKLVAQRQIVLIEFYESLGLEREHAVQLVRDLPAEILRELK